MERGRELRVVLASASPRRRELLGQIGLDFEVRVSDVEERVKSSAPGLVVEELSLQKAEAVMAALEKEASPHEPAGAGAEALLHETEDVQTSHAADAVEELLVIGADTVVWAEGRILGKPSDAEDAAKMLKMLSGSTHEVYTGVCLLYRNSVGVTERKSFHEMTRVSFYPMSEKENSFYVSSGECADKAGAYGIQGLGARFIRKIEGDYNNVVGLPVGRLYQEIKQWIEV